MDNLSQLWNELQHDNVERMPRLLLLDSGVQSSSNQQFDLLSNPQSRRRQGIYWILTIPKNNWEPKLENGVKYCKGQLEISHETSYEHWQVLFILERKGSLASIQSILGFTQFHGELCYSNQGAHDYVWKEDTAVPGTRFELGEQPKRRNSSQDWELFFLFAQHGNFNAIPADVRIRYYPTFKKICNDFAKPAFMERVCVVYWGPTGSGKSRKAWEEAGVDAYPKNPRTKWWDAYRGQKNVIIDEFRGDIDVGYILRWLDRYPVLIETKGSGTTLNATHYWITSNLHPDSWYPMLDHDTKQALLRRLTIVHIDYPDANPDANPDPSPNPTYGGYEV